MVTPNDTQALNLESREQEDETSDMKDPVDAGSSDMDEEMTKPIPVQDYRTLMDKTNLVDKDRVHRAKARVSKAYHQPNEEASDISWRPDPSGHPRRTF
ncbi:uncharacterized protein N7518_002889 [Penicillium psychrosexuale]|uniref:uncharacterized protein n=1 Tax=Penicillium psychrosexuale TaxID=1002107 RepID=UPI002545B861|nr:uncharacterized protein N7518_002889 [Penicillium psychrosexuale]KAJ5800821.1 hypothetical protein N7518_002889 [Penicillium psychrosexuale]